MSKNSRMSVRKEKNDNKDTLDVFESKKELVLKEYDSLFAVYGRETNIVFTFRSWTITLLTGYYGLLLATDLHYSKSILLLIPYFILFAFLMLEAAERSVMLKLLKEVRDLEKIFMVSSKSKFRKHINSYIFRDIRDSNIKFLDRLVNFIFAFKTPQIISWYPILIILNFLIVSFIISQKSIIPDSPSILHV